MEGPKGFSKKLKDLQAFEVLETLKTNLYYCIEDAKKQNREESVVYVGEGLRQLHEAITVKKGNEEQA